MWSVNTFYTLGCGFIEGCTGRYQERIGEGPVRYRWCSRRGPAHDPAPGGRLRVVVVGDRVTSVPGSRVSFAGGAGPDLLRYRVDFSKRFVRVSRIRALLSAGLVYEVLRPQTGGRFMPGAQTAQEGR